MNLPPLLEKAVRSWPRWSRSAIARGLALFLGGFSLVNLVRWAGGEGFDGNLWWIDLRMVPSLLAQVFLLLASLCLVGHGLGPPRSSWGRGLTLACLAGLLLGALINAGQFYWLLATGGIRAGVPIPLSLLMASAFGLLIFDSRSHPRVDTGRDGLWRPMVIAAMFALVFPFAQMLFFGKTDYRRPADVAVVFGARVYADGRLSDALADRVRTACELYRLGLVRLLVFSGGPGDGAIHETEGMKRAALKLGVPEEAIVLDQAGWNTCATVRSSRALFARLHAARVLVVSHAYHLPRVKLAFQRAGLEVYTVPARESYFLRQMPYNMCREAVALWVYYFRPGLAA